MEIIKTFRKNQSIYKSKLINKKMTNNNKS